MKENRVPIRYGAGALRRFNHSEKGTTGMERGAKFGKKKFWHENARSEKIFAHREIGRREWSEHEETESRSFLLPTLLRAAFSLSLDFPTAGKWVKEELEGVVIAIHRSLGRRGPEGGFFF